MGISRSMALPHTQESGDPYYIGDVYEKSQIRLKWAKRSNDDRSSSTPYLNHIDRLTDNGWPQLRYLADWMRVTTAPPKWKLLSKEDVDERAARVKVTVLEYRKDMTRRYESTTSAHLASLLRDMSGHHNDIIARYFIVQDLSRDMIEILGSQLDIDPMFFRGHISDYTWYNTRDPWIEIPAMDIVSRNQSFFHVRYAHARYFRTPTSYSRARLEAGTFNVLRRVDRDGSWVPGADITGSNVGLVRSKMSFWTQPRKSRGSGIVTGILLVDPTISEGFPLWGNYNDFVPCPSIADDIPRKPVTNSTYDKAVYWLEQMTAKEILTAAQDPRMLFQKPLCIVGSEWLTLLRYSNTRLSQLEWEIEDPNLRNRQEDLSTTLDKIHAWRRRFPIYKTIVSEALNKVVRRDNFARATENSLLVLERDFEIILSELNDLHERAERIMSVVTAVMSIEESKKSLQQDRSLARLTYLAVTFVPLSFVSSFFAMSEDVSKLSQTFWIYFAVAIPVTLLALVLVRFSDTVINISRRITHWFRRTEPRYVKWE
ncbi:MAG: hypothetical protein L6R40_007845 [Gallowayella cf. fulva]|nr:MAG: hypothetical protein L6R40_007845 [Xanthomendoza cf. fulva]